jgi:hypothetical protein
LNRRINIILGKIDIEVDDDSLNEFNRSYYPDLRSALNKIQTWMMDGTRKIDINKIKELGWTYEGLYNLIINSKDPINNYRSIAGEYQGKVDEVMGALGNEFIEWIIKNHPNLKNIIPGVIVLVAEHQAQRIQVIDPMVSLLSLIYKIQKTIE